MQVEVSRVDDATARMTVSLTVEEVDSAVEATYRRIGGRLKIPGFRPGKAPRPLILRTYGEHDFYHQVTDEAIRNWYPRALRESGIDALDSGQLEDEDDERHVTPGESFAFSALVPTMPEFTLPEYGEIKIAPPPTAIGEEDIDKVIESIRSARATLEPAPAKAAAVGDVVKMNIRGRSGGEEVVKQEDFDYEMVEAEKDTETPFPGLSKELVGARPGDIREVTLSLPDDYREEELAGKSLILNIVVKEIQRKVLPDLNDEFVKQVSRAENIAGLREIVRHNLEHEKNDEAISKVGTEVIDSLIARSNPAAPDILVSDEQDRMLRRQRQYFDRSGLRFDQFLIAARKSEDEYRDDLRPAALRTIQRDILLDAVAKAENLEPDSDAIEAEVKRTSGALSSSERDFERLAESRRLHDLVAEDLRRRAALNKLVEMTSGLTPMAHDHDQAEDVAVSGDEPELTPEEAVAGL